MKRKAPAQLQFKALKDFTRLEHGGDLRKGKRKLARPIAVKTSMHLVLRSSKAKGAHSMLKAAHTHRISALVVKHAQRNRVQVQQFANAGNHLHILIRAQTKAGFKAFLRTISGLIARLITGAVKGRPNGTFWDALAFSRVVKWGMDRKNASRYVLQNAMEAFGVPTERKPVRNFKAKLYGFD